MRAVPEICCTSQTHLTNVSCLFCIYWALIIHICEELCICALPGRLEPSPRMMWWFYDSCPDTEVFNRNDMERFWFFVGFFLFLLCFTATKLCHIVLRILVVYVLAIYDQWKLKFSLTEGGSGKARHLEDPQTEFLLDSGEMEEGRDKRQGLHELLMIPYSWNLLSLLSGCMSSCEPVTPAELCSVGVETWCSFSVDVAVNF